MKLSAGRIAKLVLWITLGLALLIPVWAYFFLDSPPPEDADLRLAPLSVPDELNGFRLLSLEENEIWWPESAAEEGAGEDEGAARIEVDELASGDKWDPELARTVLEKNRTVLQRFDESLELPQFRSLRITRVGQVSFRPLLVMRKLWYLQSIRIWALSRSGDDAGAFREGLKAARFGHRCEAAGGPLIEYLVGSAVKTMALTNLDRLITGTKLGAEALQPVLRALPSFATGREVLADCFKAEYTFEVLYSDAVSAGEAPSPSPPDLMGGRPLPWPWSSRIFFLPNQSKRLLAAAYRGLLPGVTALPPWKEIDYPKLFGPPVKPWFPGRNSAGRHEINDVARTIERTIERHRETHLRLTFTCLLLALKCHKIVRGALPARLDELVPEYLGEVPMDPYDGKPLRYSAERRILWSAGKDGKDEGGLISADGPTAIELNEPTFAIGL